MHYLFVSILIADLRAILVVLQFLLLFSFPGSVLAVMYASTFISDVFFSGLIATRVKKIVARMNL
jgi:hypothetical protein